MQNMRKWTYFKKTHRYMFSMDEPDYFYTALEVAAFKRRAQK